MSLSLVESRSLSESGEALPRSKPHCCDLLNAFSDPNKMALESGVLELEPSLRCSDKVMS